MNKNYLFILSGILLVGITFSAVQIIQAASKTITPGGAPTPVGHSWSQISDFDCLAGYCLQKNASGTLTCESCGGTGGYWTQSADGTKIYPSTLSNNVGIGTDIPGAKLHVSGGNTYLGDGANTTIIRNNLTVASGGGYVPRIIIDSSWPYKFGIWLYNPASSPQRLSIKDETAGIERLVITNTGNVGIGTTSPQAKLDVNGGIRVNTSATRTRTTDGFACTDINTNAQITGETVTCDSTHRGTIEIIKNTCGDGTIRDSLCYCGEYGTAGTYKWICLISCP